MLTPKEVSHIIGERQRLELDTSLYIGDTQRLGSDRTVKLEEEYVVTEGVFDWL